MKIPGVNHHPMFWFKGEESSMVDGMISPAQAVLVDAGFGEPAVLFGKGGQREPAMASSGASSPGAAAPQARVEDRATVALPESSEPAFLITDDVQPVSDEFYRKLESLLPPNDPQLLSKDLPPLPVSGKLEPEDLHQG